MYTPERGRYVVAARDILVGECIIHEEAIVNNVKFELSISHCYNCNKDTRIRPIPCDRCAGVVFCSNECKTKAEFGHKYDCPLSIFDLYLQHGNTGIGTTYLMFMAYKLIAQKPPQFFHQLFEQKNYFKPNQNGHTENSTIENDRNMKAAFPIGQDKFDRYDIFLNLVTHIDVVSLEEIMERVITSIFLLNCLEATNYFSDGHSASNKDDNSKKDDNYFQTRIMFASLLFHTYSAILSNSLAISEINASEVQENQNTNTVNRIQRTITGNAVFPRCASMINHSCDPNTTCIFINGKTQVSIYDKYFIS